MSYKDVQSGWEFHNLIGNRAQKSEKYLGQFRVRGSPDSGNMKNNIIFMTLKF